MMILLQITRNQTNDKHGFVDQLFLRLMAFKHSQLIIADTGHSSQITRFPRRVAGLQI
jgi:hypothetical protein